MHTLSPSAIVLVLAGSIAYADASGSDRVGTVNGT